MCGWAGYGGPLEAKLSRQEIEIQEGAQAVADAQRVVDNNVSKAREILKSVPHSLSSVAVAFAAIDTSLAALNIRIGEQNARVDKRLGALVEQREYLYTCLRDVIGALDEAYGNGLVSEKPGKHAAYHLETSYRAGRDLSDQLDGIMAKEAQVDVKSN